MNVTHDGKLLIADGRSRKSAQWQNRELQRSELLTFLPGAVIEGGDDLFTPSVPFDQIAYVPDSEATTIAALKDDYNALLAAIRTAGLMVTGK